jgi:hypothetical protein
MKKLSDSHGLFLAGSLLIQRFERENTLQNLKKTIEILIFFLSLLWIALVWVSIWKGKGNLLDTYVYPKFPRKLYQQRLSDTE